jgi:S-adenosylmethionine decarboxylase proenzyme
MNYLGVHILAEYHLCDSVIIDNCELVKRFMEESAIKCGAHIIGSKFHKFLPQGVSGVVVIEESHLSIHSWPEFLFCAVDIFTCGKNLDPYIAFEFLRESFKSKNYSCIEIKRGLLNNGVTS